MAITFDAGIIWKVKFWNWNQYYGSINKKKIS